MVNKWVVSPTILGTNISPTKALLKIIFLFPLVRHVGSLEGNSRWGIPWGERPTPLESDHFQPGHPVEKRHWAPGCVSPPGWIPGFCQITKVLPLAPRLKHPWEKCRFFNKPPQKWMVVTTPLTKWKDKTVGEIPMV